LLNRNYGVLSLLPVGVLVERLNIKGLDRGSDAEKCLRTPLWRSSLKLSTLSSLEGIMTTENYSRRQSWKDLNEATLLECDSAKLPSLINDAMNSVLDQIEETQSLDELEELNKALNSLRSRKKQVSSSLGRDAEKSAPSKAA